MDHWSDLVQQSFISVYVKSQLQQISATHQIQLRFNRYHSADICKRLDALVPMLGWNKDGWLLVCLYHVTALVHCGSFFPFLHLTLCLLCHSRKCHRAKNPKLFQCLASPSPETWHLLQDFLAVQEIWEVCVSSSGNFTALSHEFVLTLQEDDSSFPRLRVASVSQKDWKKEGMFAFGHRAGEECRVSEAMGIVANATFLCACLLPCACGACSSSTLANNTEIVTKTAWSLLHFHCQRKLTLKEQAHIFFAGWVGQFRQCSPNWLRKSMEEEHGHASLPPWLAH